MNHRHTLRQFHRNFVVKYGLDSSLFAEYIKYIKDLRWGSLDGGEARRNEISLKKGRGMGFQVHHILPRCLGGDGSVGNKVLLRPSEHLRAHRILQSCLEETGNLILANRHGY